MTGGVLCPGGHPPLCGRPNRAFHVAAWSGPRQLLHPVLDGTGGPAGHGPAGAVFPLRHAAQGRGAVKGHTTRLACPQL